VIGLVGGWDAERQEPSVAHEYVRAVEAAGGVAEVIPLVSTTSEDPAARLARMDGFILCGHAGDIDPARYGQPRHPQVKTIHPERDETDWRVLEHAFRTRKPVLGICFGMQSLNVYRGGTLIQHIPGQVPGALNHEDRTIEHAVQIEPGSRLEEWAGGRRQLRVNSTHHQQNWD
jgi:putative glutamine amidotransferase